MYLKDENGDLYPLTTARIIITEFYRSGEDGELNIDGDPKYGLDLVYGVQSSMDSDSFCEHVSDNVMIYENSSKDKVIEMRSMLETAIVSAHNLSSIIIDFGSILAQAKINDLIKGGTK